MVEDAHVNKVPTERLHLPKYLVILPKLNYLICVIHKFHSFYFTCLLGTIYYVIYVLL